MTAFLRQHILPAAYALLPSAMHSDRASAMLIAIALQESELRRRRQMHNGPARGFWQFERDGGVAEVVSHHATYPIIRVVLETLRYPVFVPDCYQALEHNDVLAACFARCLLYTLPDRLPAREERDEGWRQYLAAWKPGRPHPDTWKANFDAAWGLVE